jgi:hypothetical protein
MQTIGKPTATGNRALKLGAFMGVILLGLIAAAKLSGMTGNGTITTVLMLLYLTAAATLLAPHEAKNPHMCG